MANEGDILAIAVIGGALALALVLNLVNWWRLILHDLRGRGHGRPDKVDFPSGPGLTHVRPPRRKTGQPDREPAVRWGKMCSGRAAIRRHL